MDPKRGYEWPYHYDYPLNNNLAIDPTGKYIFNGSGYFFSTSPDKSTDMIYAGRLGTGFTDIAFEPDLARVYTLPLDNNTVNIYDGTIFSLVKSTQLAEKGKFLFMKDEKLIALIEPSPTPGYITGIQTVNNTAVQPLPSIPLVQTNYVSGVTTTAATVRGSVYSNGGGIVTEYGFYWGTDATTPNEIVVGTDNRSGAFDYGLTGLTSGITYYFRAYAKNSTGTGFGEVKSFQIGCLKGDVYGDGFINVQDVVQIVNIILGKVAPADSERCAADANNDGNINVQDVVEIVNMILGKV